MAQVHPDSIALSLHPLRPDDLAEFPPIGCHRSSTQMNQIQLYLRSLQVDRPENTLLLVDATDAGGFGWREPKTDVEQENRARGGICSRGVDMMALFRHT